MLFSIRKWHMQRRSHPGGGVCSALHPCRTVCAVSFVLPSPKGLYSPLLSQSNGQCGSHLRRCVCCAIHPLEMYAVLLILLKERTHLFSQGMYEVSFSLPKGGMQCRLYVCSPEVMHAFTLSKGYIQYPLPTQRGVYGAIRSPEKVHAVPFIFSEGCMQRRSLFTRGVCIYSL